MNNTNHTLGIKQGTIIWTNQDNNVCLVRVPDEDCTFEYIEGDTFNPIANPDIDPEELKKQETKAKKDFEEEGGASGILSYYKCPCCNIWVQSIESIWGIWGIDWDHFNPNDEGLEYLYTTAEAQLKTVSEKLK